jgi:hypothetical protein
MSIRVSEVAISKAIWKGSIHRSLFHLTNKGSIHRSVF